MKMRIVCCSGVSPDDFLENREKDLAVATLQDADDSTIEGASSIEEWEEQEWQDSFLTELPRSDWWADADVGTPEGYRGIASASTLLSAQVVRLNRGMPVHNEELYWQLGARKPTGRYIAVTLGFGENVLTFVSEIAETCLFEKCVAGNFMQERLKFILNPVKVKMPLPSKGPESADTVGTFFAGEASKHCRSQLACGAQVESVYIDVFSKWMVRLAFKQCGFKLGNVVELLLIDWQNRAALASIRVLVTEEFLQLTA